MGGRCERVIGGEWEDQRADFTLGALRIRVEIERGWVDLLFAARQDPGEWFRAAHLIPFLGGDYEEGEPDPAASIAQIERVLPAHLRAIQACFAAGEYEATKRTLREQLRRQHGKPDARATGKEAGLGSPAHAGQLSEAVSSERHRVGDPPLADRIRWGVGRGLPIGLLYAALVLLMYYAKGPAYLGVPGTSVPSALGLYIVAGAIGGAIVGALLPLRRVTGGRSVIGIAVMLPVCAAFGTLLLGAPTDWRGAECFAVLSSGVLLGGFGGATTS